MADINLELRHANPWGVERKTHLIERPEGFGDEEYTLHARAAANLVARVLSGEPGDMLRVRGVVMMVVEEGVLSEGEITGQLDEAAWKANDNQRWRAAHVVEAELPASAGQ